MRNTKIKFMLSLILSLLWGVSVGQGFLHTEGKKIVNGNNEEVILRSMNLGGWMLKEGYLMGTSGFADTQHELHQKIVDLIGQNNADEFFNKWLDTYMSKKDVDSLAAWGFNSIRLPIHYNLFTLPIEQEPVAGQNTWLTKGFELTDSLVSWCAANQMYVIIDLHAAPGGQGANAAISDYDPTKPSLWESAENRSKTVALWRKIAERYANEPWIGGYDLINETNWTLPGNTLLRQLSEDITTAIRQVDQNHIVYIEGNSWANDFTGMTPPWDNNMVYAPHKYWSHNETADIQWVLDIRDTYNVPLWFGETGENSNAWFTDCTKLLLSHGIGVAWWPMKKVGEIDGIMTIEKSNDYQTLLDYWNGIGSAPSVTFAKNALMGMADNLKMENCQINYGVLDALFRRVATNETTPFKNHQLPGTIYAADYDNGNQGYAYNDHEYANYHVTTGTWTAWNNGWVYRNDGVDIEASTDSGPNMGYIVGWTEDGDWMQYTTNVTTSGAYDVKLRYASATSTTLHFESNGVAVSEQYNLPGTGGYSSWSDFTIQDVILSQGVNKIRLVIDQAGCNLNFYEFFNPQNIASVPFKFLSADTRSSSKISVTMNKSISAVSTAPAGFEVKVNGESKAALSVSINPSDDKQVFIEIDDYLFNTDVITVSYNGNGVSTQGGTLTQFTNKPCTNNLEAVYQIPGRIESENFVEMSGIGVENTSDVDGVKNIGWLHQGDWADYLVFVAEAGNFELNLRVSSAYSGGQMQLKDSIGQVLTTIDVPGTGSWTTWQTISGTVQLPQGYNKLRFFVSTSGEFNCNWIEFIKLTQGTRIEAESYSAMNGISTENCSDEEGGLNVGWIDNNDWMEYTVNVPTTSAYLIEYRVASNSDGGKISLQNGGQELSLVTVPNTGGWQTWQTISTVVSLSAGSTTIRLAAPQGGYNLNWWSLAQIDDNQAPSTPAVLNVQPGFNYANVSWSAASDDYGVMEYHVFLNGAQVGVTSNTSYTLDGLSPTTSYSVGVRAVDASLNVSGLRSTTFSTTQVPPDGLLFQNSSGGNKMEVNNGLNGAQSFKHGTAGSTYTVTKVQVYLSKENNPNGNLEFNIGTSINGGALSGSAVSITPAQVTNNSAGNNFTLYSIVLSQPVVLNGDQTYYLNFSTSASNGKKFFLEYSSNNSYAEGTWYKGGSNDGKDARFKIFGYSGGARYATYILSEDVKPGFVIYPNPSDGITLHIDVPAKFQNASYSLIDMTGVVVYKQEVESQGEVLINFSQKLKNGVYVLRVIANDAVHSEIILVR